MQHYATKCCDLQKSGPKQASCHEKHLNHYRRLYCHWMQNIHKNGRLPTLEILPDSSKPSSPGHACPSRLFEPSICVRFGSRKQNQGSFSLRFSSPVTMQQNSSKNVETIMFYVHHYGSRVCRSGYHRSLPHGFVSMPEILKLRAWRFEVVTVMSFQTSHVNPCVSGGWKTPQV